MRCARNLVSAELKFLGGGKVALNDVGVSAGEHRLSGEACRDEDLLKLISRESQHLEGDGLHRLAEKVVQQVPKATEVIPLLLLL